MSAWNVKQDGKLYTDVSYRQQNVSNQQQNVLKFVYFDIDNYTPIVVLYM